MKPEYKMIYNRCDSLLEAERNIQHFRQQLVALIENGSLKKTINSSTVPFVVTLILNPESQQLEGTYEAVKGKVYYKTAPEFEGDTGLYTLQMKFTKLQLPDVFESILIYIGTEEYKQTLSQNPGNSSRGNGDQPEDALPVFTAVEPSYTFDEIILTPETRHRLERASAIVKNRDLIFDRWGFGKIDKTMKSIIFFYGPAGTGKTITAHAVASYLGKKIMLSSYAQIESKWVGEGPKNLHAIFDAAKEQDAVLFMDEADSFLSNRISDTSTGSDKHYNRMSNELFQLLETFDGCVIFATNLVSDVDSAFKSRIVDSILFPLPDLEGRISLIKHMLPSGIQFDHELTDEEVRKLSEDIDGFSGRDMRKSILLTLADASIEAAVAPDSYRFTSDSYRKGFMEVKGYKEEMEKEANGGALIDAVQEVLDKERFSEKNMQIAQYVLYADGIVEPEEQRLLDELSKTLGVDSPKWEETCKIPIAEICQGLKSKEEKGKLLNIACRMAASDGKVPDCEITLIREIYIALGFQSTDHFEDVVNYINQLIDTNTKWASCIAHTCE